MTEIFAVSNSTSNVILNAKHIIQIDTSHIAGPKLSNVAQDMHMEKLHIF